MANGLLFNEIQSILVRVHINIEQINNTKNGIEINEIKWEFVSVIIYLKKKIINKILDFKMLQMSDSKLILNSTESFMIVELLFHIIYEKTSVNQKI